MNLDPEFQLASLQERTARARRAHGPGYRAWGLRALGVFLVVLRDLAFGQLTLRAMSLVYTTLLSIVPMLALSFSVLKAFGVHNQIEPALGRFLEPLGERGAEVTQQIIQFIANMNVGVLGSLGLALLLYTAISLIQKIEMSFNFIWHVPEPRRFGTRFSSYISVLLVGPLLVFSALGITAAVSSIGVVKGLLAIEPLGRLAAEIGKLLPYAAIGMLDVLLVVGVAVFWFEIPLRGSLPLLLGMSLIYLLSTLGLGLFVSTISSTQQQAMMTTTFFFMLPMIFLSGFVFPIENMPEAIQPVTYLIPLRYFLVIVRGIFQKGVGLEILWPQAVALLAWGLAMLTLATLRSSKRLG